MPGEFTDAEAFDRLANCVAELDRERGTGGNYAFYLSVPPKFFELVVTQLKRSGLSPRPRRPRDIHGPGAESLSRSRSVMT